MLVLVLLVYTVLVGQEKGYQHYAPRLYGSRWRAFRGCWRRPSVAQLTETCHCSVRRGVQRCMIGAASVARRWCRACMGGGGGERGVVSGVLNAYNAGWVSVGGYGACVGAGCVASSCFFCSAVRHVSNLRCISVKCSRVRCINWLAWAYVGVGAQSAVAWQVAWRSVRGVLRACVSVGA